MIKIEVAKKKELPLILKLYASEDIDNGKVLSVSEAEAIFMKMKTYPNYKLFVLLRTPFLRMRNPSVWNYSNKKSNFWCLKIINFE